jgi:hypothetical protein
MQLHPHFLFNTLHGIHRSGHLRDLNLSRLNYGIPASPACFLRMVMSLPHCASGSATRALLKPDFRK